MPRGATKSEMRQRPQAAQHRLNDAAERGRRIQEIYGNGERVPMGSDNRVNRGGSWRTNARNCRAANRDRDDPANRNDNLGFRPALSPSSAREAGSTDPACEHKDGQIRFLGPPGPNLAGSPGQVALQPRSMGSD